MDRIAGMEAFVAVVEAGGFQGAARQLGVSRALISKRLSALERTLGRPAAASDHASAVGHRAGVDVLRELPRDPAASTARRPAS